MGSLAQAQDGAQAKKYHENILTAERERKARCTARRQSMQKGGVLYASEARKMATERVEDELERARGIVSRAAKAPILSFTVTHT